MVLTAIAVFFKFYSGLIIILFFMSIQSAFFGPVKYSIIPQHLEECELIEGNAIIDGATYFSILLGTILGAHITSPEITVGILVFCSLLGMLSSF